MWTARAGSARRPAVEDQVYPPAPFFTIFNLVFAERHEVSERRTRASNEMFYAIKVEIIDPAVETFSFARQKTMYDGKRVAAGDPIYIFASESKGGHGLIAKGVVSSADAVPRAQGIERQTPRVSIVVKRTTQVKRRLGRSELKPFNRWGDGRPETELNFKLYRQATNKIVGISDEAGAFLEQYVE